MVLARAFRDCLGASPCAPVEDLGVNPCALVEDLEVSPCAQVGDEEPLEALVDQPNREELEFHPLATLVGEMEAK